MQTKFENNPRFRADVSLTEQPHTGLIFKRKYLI